MYFDGALNQKGFRVGIILISPDGEHTPISIKMDLELNNNMVGYKACFFGSQATIEIGLKNI